MRHANVHILGLSGAKNDLLTQQSTNKNVCLRFMLAAIAKNNPVRRSNHCA